VLEHLKRAGVPRRPNTRKLTDDRVAAAAVVYANGSSLSATAIQLGVSDRTLRNELARAGHPIRPRNGCE
jgi:lambda repressor-like predicted transcriptional regulator